MSARFVGPGAAAEVAVIVVTFNNADHLADLFASLRVEAAGVGMRVIVADNGSTDATVRLVHEQSDVLTVDTHGNRGYATGINLAMAAAGDTGAVLILNPDLVVDRGAVRAMLERMHASGAGAVVPRILSADGDTYPSLRREPSTARALGDALLGRRSGRFGENDHSPASYGRAHTVDWATGAAVLVAADTARAVGGWDGRFFLYSEETDFLRRVREAGFGVWFEPTAVMRHEGGGSGTSPELQALMAVNRVRYVRKHHGAGYAAGFHAAVLLHEAMRAYNAGHRATLRTLLDQSSWRRLPRATRWPATTGALGAIIVPAHNEAAVIGRTLRTLAPLAASGRVEVIVVCNGCTDATAAIAREVPGVRVLETESRGKPAALNTGDAAATLWPRLYLDADIEIHPGAVEAVFAELGGGTLAARPSFRYDTRGASALVRAYYRARDRMPSTHGSLWGAGAYAMSRAGHERFGAFPPELADDLAVDAAFGPGEKTVVDTEPVRVRTPRRARDLVAVLTRQRRGNLGSAAASTTASTVRELVGATRGPLRFYDSAAYLFFTSFGRYSAAKADPETEWERDESSRSEGELVSPFEKSPFYRLKCFGATPRRTANASVEEKN